MTKFIAALIGVALTLTACSGATSNPTDSAQSVTLEISGPAKADITYGIGADQTQEIGAALPWKKEVTVRAALLIVVLSAQSKGTGEIACKLSVDGKVIKENRSTGKFATVMCSSA